MMQPVTVTVEFDRVDRSVSLLLPAGLDPIECGTRRQSRRFVPDRIQIDWRNGEVEWVRLSGCRKLKSGEMSLSREALHFNGKRTPLRTFDGHSLPGWAVPIVEQYIRREVEPEIEPGSQIG